MKFSKTFVPMILAILFASSLWSSEQIIFWDKQVKAGESATVIFPAQLTTTLTIINPIKGNTYTLKSKNCKSISQSKIATASSPLIFILKYSRVEEPDKLNLFSSPSSKDKGKPVASFLVYPVTVLLRSSYMNFDFVKGYVEQLEEELELEIVDVKYQVYPWNDALKNKLALKVFKPLLGTPSIELSKTVIDSKQGLIKLKLTKGDIGVTAITAVFQSEDKNIGVKNIGLVECGTRLCVVIEADDLKYKNATLIGEDKKLEAFLTKWWHLIDLRPLKQREATLEKFKIILRKCPKIPYYREAFIDFMNNPILYKTIYYHVIRNDNVEGLPQALAQFALAYIPIDKAF